MKEFDKILPNQKALKANYFGSSFNYEKKIYDICLKHSSFDIPCLASLKGIPEVSKTWMSSTSLSLSFFAFLIHIIKPKKVLEIGTFIGRATKTFLQESGKKCHITTIEKFASAYQAANSNLKNEVKAKRCKILKGNALTLLKTNKISKSKFDLVFIDGDKESYHKYLKLLSRKIKTNGLIIIDDIFFQGDIMNYRPKTEKGRGVKKCLSFAHNLNGFNKICIPLGNGILILQKK